MATACPYFWRTTLTSAGCCAVCHDDIWRSHRIHGTRSSVCCRHCNSCRDFSLGPSAAATSPVRYDVCTRSFVEYIGMSDFGPRAELQDRVSTDEVAQAFVLLAIDQPCHFIAGHDDDCKPRDCVYDGKRWPTYYSPQAPTQLGRVTHISSNAHFLRSVCWCFSVMICCKVSVQIEPISSSPGISECHRQ